MHSSDKGSGTENLESQHPTRVVKGKRNDARIYEDNNDNNDNDDGNERRTIYI